MHSRDKLCSEYSVLNSISRTLTWYVCVCVCVCFCQSKVNKKPDIDALAVCKIVSEEYDRRETNVRSVGCGMDPPDGHAVFPGPS